MPSYLPIQATKSNNALAGSDELNKEIAREFGIAEIQADLLRQSLEHLYGRLDVVMRPAGPETPEKGIDRSMPETQIGQRINSLTLEFKRANDVVGSILQRLELQ